MHASPQPHGIIFQSTADQRGFAFMLRWCELGCEIGTTVQGHLDMIVQPNPDRSPEEALEIANMLSSLKHDPLLVHCLARAVIDCLKWDYATNPGGARQ